MWFHHYLLITNIYFVAKRTHNMKCTFLKAKNMTAIIGLKEPLSKKSKLYFAKFPKIDAGPEIF